MYKHARRIAATAIILAAAHAGARENDATSVEVHSVVVNLAAEVELAAEVAGPLVELNVTEGKRVKTGDLLGRLDDRDAALEVAKAEIALKHAQQLAASKVKLLKAEEARELARLELDRATAANQELARVVSDSQLAKLRLLLRQAELDVEQAEDDRAAAARAVEAATSELAIAQRARERRQILAPMDGVVVEVRRHVGEWLEPGKPVLRLVRDDRLRAMGFAKLDQLVAPLEGAPATLTVVLPGSQEAQFTGRVSFVSPESNPINRQVKVIAEFENPDGRLRAGLSAKMAVRVDAPSAKP
jgi:multidrug efflux pump subunit AcrA (membrane-fusion protein)